MLELVIQLNYIHCFGVVYDQMSGIPMGVSPGVFLANDYLCTYELAHMQQLGAVLRAHPPQVADPLVWGKALAENPLAMRAQHGNALEGCLALYVWRSWKYVLRFVDDLQVIGHKFVRQLFDNTQRFVGSDIFGVHPPHLTLKEQEHEGPGRVPYLDVLQRFTNFGGRLHVRTDLYDRRRQHAFHALRVAQYTHATSAVHPDTLASSVIGQTHRVLLLVSTHLGQVQELGCMAAKYLQQGYGASTLERCMRRCFHKYIYLLHRAKPKHVMVAVKWEVARLAAQRAADRG